MEGLVKVRGLLNFSIVFGRWRCVSSVGLYLYVNRFFLVSVEFRVHRVGYWTF